MSNLLAFNGTELCLFIQPWDPGGDSSALARRVDLEVLFILCNKLLLGAIIKTF